MKIAVSTKNGNVDYHFGHCDHYSIFTIENNKIIRSEEFASPDGCGCKTGIASELKNKGIEVMLAGSMGEGALAKLTASGIKVVRGCKGNVEVLVKAYLNGEIKDSGVGCKGHDGNHECGNGHKQNKNDNCQCKD